MPNQRPPIYDIGKKSGNRAVIVLWSLRLLSTYSKWSHKKLHRLWLVWVAMRIILFHDTPIGSRNDELRFS